MSVIQPALVPGYEDFTLADGQQWLSEVMACACMGPPDPVPAGWPRGLRGDMRYPSCRCEATAAHSLLLRAFAAAFATGMAELLRREQWISGTSDEAIGGFDTETETT